MPYPILARRGSYKPVWSMKSREGIIIEADCPSSSIALGWQGCIAGMIWPKRPENPSRREWLAPLLNPAMANTECPPTSWPVGTFADRQRRSPARPFREYETVHRPNCSRAQSNVSQRLVGLAASHGGDERQRRLAAALFSEKTAPNSKQGSAAYQQAQEICVSRTRNSHAGTQQAVRR